MSTLLNAQDFKQQKNRRFHRHNTSQHRLSTNAFSLESNYKNYLQSLFFWGKLFFHTPSNEYLHHTNYLHFIT